MQGKTEKERKELKTAVPNTASMPQMPDMMGMPMQYMPQAMPQQQMYTQPMYAGQQLGMTDMTGGMQGMPQTPYGYCPYMAMMQQMQQMNQMNQMNQMQGGMPGYMPMSGCGMMPQYTQGCGRDKNS